MLPTNRRRAYMPTFFNEFLNDDFSASSHNRRGQGPAVNIKEDDKQYIIELAIPGMSKGDVNIDIEKDILLVSSGKSEEKKEEQDAYSRREFGKMSFCRSFSIPDDVKSDDINASFKNGILNIELPKSEEEAKLKRKVKIS